jgi:hypothetical protein
MVSNTVNNSSTMYDPIVDNQQQRRIDANNNQIIGTVTRYNFTTTIIDDSGNTVEDIPISHQLQQYNQSIESYLTRPQDSNNNLRNYTQTNDPVNLQLQNENKESEREYAIQNNNYIRNEIGETIAAYASGTNNTHGQLNNNQDNTQIVENNNIINNIVTDVTIHDYQPYSCVHINNVARGDILGLKPHDHFRVGFQNIFGFRAPKLDKWLATTEKIKEHQFDIVGFCETGINWNVKSQKKRYQQGLSNKSTLGVLSNPNISTSSINIPYKGERLPGGTALITNGKWSSRIIQPIKDVFEMGRWSGNVYRLTGQKQLHIVVGYRPCRLTIGPSTSLSTAHQQATIIEQRRLQNTNPRKQFIEDFIYQFEEICNNPNNYILFVLDANANVNEDANGIKKLITKWHMIDIYTHKHDDYEEFGTQERGSKRIDYMFGSRNILQYITNVGYPPFNEAFDSDHRSIFADISHTIMENPIPIIEKRIRLVGTNSTNKEGDRYVRHLYKSLLKDKVFERVRILFEQSIQ